MIVEFVIFIDERSIRNCRPQADHAPFLKVRLAERNSASQQGKPTWFGAFPGIHLLARIGGTAVVLALAVFF